MAMNSPRELSGVFVSSSIPSASFKKGTMPCMRKQARGREEISRSYCCPAASPTSPGAPRRRAASPTSPKGAGARHRGASPVPPMMYPKSPQVQRRASLAAPPGGTSRSLGEHTTIASLRRSMRDPRLNLDVKATPEATRTVDAISGALRAVQTALIKTKSLTADCSPSPTPSEADCMSLCGTECTESTACSSEDGNINITNGRFQVVRQASLRDARRIMKERVRAEDRAVRFTRGLLLKLDELRDVVTEEEVA